MLTIDLKDRRFYTNDGAFPLATIFDELVKLVPNIGFFARVSFDDEGQPLDPIPHRSSGDLEIKGTVTASQVMEFDGYKQAVLDAEDAAEEASIRQAIADEAFEADERTKALRQKQAERKEKLNGESAAAKSN